MIDGKRGAFLLAGAAAFTAIGASYVAVRTPSRSAAFSWLPGQIGSDELGWIWVVLGLLCEGSALVSGRCPRIASIGYGLLMAPPALWAVIFLGAWLTGAHPLGWVSALSYGLMATWIWIASDWPNPLPPRGGRAPDGLRGAEEAPGD